MRGIIDISQLSEEEYWNVVRVITKDVALRKAEQDRIKSLQKQFDDTRRAIMVRSVQKGSWSWDEHCLICGAGLLTYCCLFYRGAECISCEHVVCPKCRKILLGTDDNAFLCLLCVKKREVKRKSCEWFYEAVERKFKRFGSAKILRALCKQKEKVDHQFVTLLAVVRELSFGSGRKYSVARPITSLFKEDTVFGGVFQRSRVGSSRIRTLSSPDATSLSEAEEILKSEIEEGEDAVETEGSPHTTLAKRLSLPAKLMYESQGTDPEKKEIHYRELVVFGSAARPQEEKDLVETENKDSQSPDDDNLTGESGIDSPRFHVNIINEVKKRMRKKSETYSQI